jgi:hypothetical protein
MYISLIIVAFFTTILFVSDDELGNIDSTLGLDPIDASPLGAVDSARNRLAAKLSHVGKQPLQPIETVKNSYPTVTPNKLPHDRLEVSSLCCTNYFILKFLMNAAIAFSGGAHSCRRICIAHVGRVWLLYNEGI